jgi:hypothetical protein
VGCGETKNTGLWLCRSARIARRGRGHPRPGPCCEWLYLVTFSPIMFRPWKTIDAAPHWSRRPRQCLSLSEASQPARYLRGRVRHPGWKRRHLIAAPGRDAIVRRYSQTRKNWMGAPCLPANLLVARYRCCCWWPPADGVSSKPHDACPCMPLMVLCARILLAAGQAHIFIIPMHSIETKRRVRSQKKKEGCV